MNLVFPLRSAFLALPLEGEAKEQFRMLQDRLRQHEDIFWFQNPASPHLTLIFWKELLEIEYKPIIAKAKEIAARSTPFTIDVTGAGTFGTRGNDRVLFLTIGFSPELATLKKLCPWPSLRSTALSYGGQADARDAQGDREFHPHITLARIRHPQRFVTVKKKIMKELAGVAFPIQVDRLRLYAEVDGVKQRVLQEFSFG